MRRLVALLFILLSPPFAAVAQLPTSPRANMVAYDDDGTIEKLAYRESPYFLELTGSWKQRRTDTSIIYTRQIEADRVWKDYLVLLNVRCGRACRVYVKGEKGDYGYNARADRYEDLRKAGIIDPAKVARVALENAASIAGMFLTTECVICDAKEDKPEMPMGGAPGMGGMM